MDKPFDRVVARRECVVRDQILMDALRAQPLDECRGDTLAVGLAETAGPGGHFGWFWVAPDSDGSQCTMHWPDPVRPS